MGSLLGIDTKQLFFYVGLIRLAYGDIPFVKTQAALIIKQAFLSAISYGEEQFNLDVKPFSLK